MRGERLEVDLHDLLVLGDEAANLPLRSGDVVYVPTGQSIHVIGEVKRPGTFPYEAGITVLKAITLAGGPTSKASPKNSVIKRIRDGKETTAKATMEDLLEPEDIVEVPLSFW